MDASDEVPGAARHTREEELLGRVAVGHAATLCGPAGPAVGLNLHEVPAGQTYDAVGPVEPLVPSPVVARASA